MNQLQKQILDVVSLGLQHERTWPEILETIRPYRTRPGWNWSMELWFDGVQSGLEASNGASLRFLQ